MANSSRGQEIDLTRLSLEQLNELKQRHDEELTQYRQSTSQLQDASQRFQRSKVIIDRFTPESEGQLLLVPLTASLFVRGRITEPSTVLVDVGTGYFVEKSIVKAKELFDRKSDMINQQIGSIESVVKQKRRNLDMIVAVMNMKVQMIQQAQANQRGAAQSDQPVSA